MPNASATLECRPSLPANSMRDLASSPVTIPDTIAGMACPGCGCDLSACMSGCGHNCRACACGTGYHVQESCEICFGTGWYYRQPDAVLTRCPRNC
jgi:hypothetical protein